MSWNGAEIGRAREKSQFSPSLTRTWSLSQTAEDEQVQDHGTRKRQKVTRACDACRSKKKRCTGDIPCRPCKRQHQQCTYDKEYARGAAVPPSPAKTLSGPSTNPSPSLIRIQEAGPGTVSPVRPVQDLDAQRTEESCPTAIPPLLSSASAPPSRRLSPEPGAATDVAGQYHGPTSAHSFLGRAWRRFEQCQPQSTIAPQPDTETAASVSVFSFGDRRIPEVDISAFAWPHPVAARELAQRYFDFAAPTYRVLHRPTVLNWIAQIYEEHLTTQQNEIQQYGAQQDRKVPAAAQAVVLMVFATASMFDTDIEGNIHDADTEGWQASELFYASAQQKIATEKGPPTLASVQARFVTVLYLLSSSRANKAWFTYGTMVQLMLALGLHRKKVMSENKPLDHISRECQKRVLWCTYTLDKYLSLVLGRPRLLQDEDIDQNFPAHVNDEDLTAGGAQHKVGKDCIMDAPIYHSQLSQVLARASKEQYSIHRISDQQHIEAACKRSEEIAVWHSRLPPFLSGAIQASSLIPVFRRQLTVLRLAHFHALMFTSRPLLLRDLAKALPEFAAQYRLQVRTCVNAATDTISLIMTFVQEGQLFPAFWYSQYITFNALSIIYIYLIQVKRGRVPMDAIFSDKNLLELAETGQHHLAQATISNAPAWRYSVILEGLKSEASRVVHATEEEREGDTRQAYSTGAFVQDQPQILMSSVREDRPEGNFSLSNAVGTAQGESISSNYGNNAIGDQIQPPLPDMDLNMFDMKAGSLFGGFEDDTNEDFGLEFWPQLDSLPLSYFGFNESIGDE